MFKQFISHSSDFISIVRSVLLLTILIIIGDASYATPSTPWKFNFSTQGISLSYQGISVINKSTLRIATPDWSKTWYKQTGKNQKVQNQADGSLHITDGNDYFRSEYDLQTPDAQTFKMHFRGELLKDVPANLEFNAGYFNGVLFYNRPFNAQIGATTDSPAHTSSGIVPAYPAKDGFTINDLAPNFQTLVFDSRIGKMSLKVSSSSRVFFIDTRRHQKYIKGPIFWCGWPGEPLTVGNSVEMTMTIHIEPPVADVSPVSDVTSIHPIATAISDAAIPRQQPEPIVPKPKEVQLNVAKYFELHNTSKWSVTVTSGEMRLTAAVQHLLNDDWKLKLPAPRTNKSTFNGWCAIRLGDDEPISFPANLANAEWATHSDAYQLTVDKTGIQIIAPTAHGAFYGVQTLAQLLYSTKNVVAVPYAQIEDWPSLQFRGGLIHPKSNNISFLKKFVGYMASYKYNYLAIDCRTLSWKSHPEIITATSISKSDMQDLVDLCRANFIEPIPLLDGPGHATWLFNNGQNLDLAENPKTHWAYAVNNPKTLKVVHELMSEIIDIFHPKIFHIGSDELNTDHGRFPDPINPFYRKEQSTTDWVLSNLFQQHDWLAKRDIKTMMWGDMFMNRQEGVSAGNAPSVQEAKKGRPAIPKDVIIADWHYESGKNYPSLNLFQNEGLKTVAATWHAPLNVRNFTLAAIEDKAWGVLQCTWGAHGDYIPFILAADYSWSGRTELPDALPYDATSRLADGLGQQIHTERSGYLLDLKPAARVAVENTWFGWNLASFFEQQKRSANRRIGGISFRISDHHSVVLSSSPGMMSPQGTLKQLTLDINQKATEIAFLHSTLWNVPYGTIAAMCTVNYADGSHNEVKFVVGTNIAPWQEGNSALKAWHGTAPSSRASVSLQIFNWSNPNPEKVIKNLSLQPVGVQAGYVLAGITLIQ